MAEVVESPTEINDLLVDLMFDLGVGDGWRFQKTLYNLRALGTLYLRNPLRHVDGVFNNRNLGRAAAYFNVLKATFEPIVEVVEPEE